jgi:CarD family transcriptional regulator
MSTVGFRVGDKVVYPNHGVGTIEQINCRSMGCGAEQFYLLKIEASNLRVMVPLSNVGSVGMRPIAKSSDIARVFDYLEEGECHTSTDWKGRFKENTEKLRTGSLLQVAEVVKGLLQLNREKPLSFREKKMLDRALGLLIDELATARHVAGPQMLEILHKTLSKAHLELPAADSAQN